MTDIHSDEPRGVAIIGIAGRFPWAGSLEAFWRNLADGVECLTEFSEAEILASGVPPTLLRDPNYVRKGSILDNPEWFDARFFGYSPREAEILDPQQRVFLECAWEALEDAGYAADGAERRVGVYAGAGMNTYLVNNLLANAAALESVSPYQIMLANDKDFLATRVSYELNLKGPSITIQTACSTSLVAVQVACESLLNGQCDMALAGGVAILFPPRSGYLYTEGMILSNDGHCRPFDADARGTRSGAGAGIVVLKRLGDALRDGDSIRAIVRGAAVNNDGSDKLGYTAPSIDGQAAAIEAAQAMAGVNPEDISYVEAHGTGTVLGDPIEIAALERVFGARTERKQFCAIGSLKSNIGHLDAAAGVAGLIKTTLALQHRAIPPSLNYTRANPHIDFANSPFFVNDRLREWNSPGRRRIAGVSSFGIGGTNAHVIVEEAPAAPPPRAARAQHVIVLSAKTEAALDQAAARLAEHLRAHPEVELADACYTLQAGRRRFPHRRFHVCERREQAIEMLTAAAGAHFSAVQESLSRPVAFLFPGQGSQHPGMAADLYGQEPAFRAVLDECAELLEPHTKCDVRSVVFGGDAALDQTRLTQPALFAFEYALARMWMAWGITPDAMLGHSIGEYVAACLAGVFSLPDAAALVSARGALMQALPPGAMLAVPLPAAEAARFASGGVSLAAVNAPSLCTVSGTEDAISKLEEELRRRDIAARRIYVSHAFHSAMMDPILAEFTGRVRQVRLSPPRLRYVSNLTGTWVRPEEATDPAYWARHLRNTVQFADGLRQLADGSARILLEVGPGQTLSTFARQVCPPGEGVEVISSLPHPRDPGSPAQFAVRALGRLWAAGAAVNWGGFHEGARLHRIPLPTYPFERKRFIVERKSENPRAAPLEKKPDLADWFYVPSWKRSVDPAALPPAATTRGPWLVFCDDKGLGEQIAQRLSDDGQDCVLVRAGSAFARTGAGWYAIDPAHRDDYDALFRALKDERRVPRSALHLWNVNDSSGPPETDRVLPFYSLIYLAQAWNELFGPEPLDLLVVSRGLHVVTADDCRPRPEKALLLGPCKVIEVEYAGMRCRSVDVPETIADNPALVSSLLHEFDLESHNPVVAYRSGRRWEQCFEPLRLSPAAGSPRLREGGVYLITGGFGGIGSTLARYLAGAFHAKLALLSRSPLPAASDQDERTRLVRELESAGAEVLVLQADVADPEAVGLAAAATRRRFGPIDGLIHAAGIAGGGLIDLKTVEAAERVLAPKVDGTLALCRALAGERLDFMLLCSSVDAVYGGIGSVDYCAANSFMDALAAARATGDAPLISIGWDTWQKVGMAVKAEIPHEWRDRREKMLRHGILADEGLEVFRRALSAKLSNLLVVTRDLPAVLREAGAASGAAIAKPGPEARTANPSSSESFSGTETNRLIRAIWIEMLGAKEIGIDDDFFELGGHSLLATGVLARVRGACGVNLPLRTIFETPTIRSLSERVDTVKWAVSAEPSTACVGEREDFEL